jgi:hypothetical protein
MENWVYWNLNHFLATCLGVRIRLTLFIGMDFVMNESQVRDKRVDLLIYEVDKRTKSTRFLVIAAMVVPNIDAEGSRGAISG